MIAVAPDLGVCWQQIMETAILSGRSAATRHRTNPQVSTIAPGAADPAEWVRQTL
jgi:hypothetical protein